MTIVLFGGTLEGRLLAEAFRESDLELHISVATQYGASLLPEASNIHVYAGRMDESQIEDFLLEKKADYCVDATHPYAAEVTKNLRHACEQCSVPYLRILREQTGLQENFEDGTDKQEELFGDSTGSQAAFVDCVGEAAQRLARTGEGNILITTGSKELAEYRVIPDYRRRCFARVLPVPDVLEQCREIGFEGRNVIGMQGPFSEELNYGMLKQLKIRYLVTKQSGAQGGYPEKCEAALRAGVHLIVVGRPEDEAAENGEGKSLEEAVSFLRSCGIVHIEKDTGANNEDPDKGQEYDSGTRQVFLIGMGPGDALSCTLEAGKCLEECDVIIGAERILKSCEGLYFKPMSACYKGQEIAVFLQDHPEYEKAAVVFSGDIGFYSGAAGVREYLKDFQVHMVPGIASPIYFLDKLGQPWENVRFTSRHGKECDLTALLQNHEKVCVLLGKKDDIPRICGELLACGMNHVRITVGERLSYPEERIVTGTPEELQNIYFDSLSVVLLERGMELPDRTNLYDDIHGMTGRREPGQGTAGEAFGQDRSGCHIPGIPDQCFVRGKAAGGSVVPMTKEEIRVLSLSRLRLMPDSVLYDVGAGTGSVSVEAALLCPEGRVYAIERNPEGIGLIRKNKEKFGADNLAVVQGEAPGVLLSSEESLDIPTHVFIGGSGGKLLEVIRAVRGKNPDTRFVINAITLETMGQITRLAEEYPEYADMEIIQVNVSKSRKLGSYHMMQGENPVYIISFGGILS